MRDFSPRGVRPARSHSRIDFFVIWLCVAVLALFGVFAGWQYWHTARIFSGVHVAGIPVGGDTRATALLRLYEELTPYPLAPIRLAYEGRQWVLGTALLAPQANLENAVNQAYLVGRQGGLLARLESQWQALIRQRVVWPEIHISEGAVRQAVGKAAAQVRRPGRSAVTIGDLSLPSQAGLEVDISATTRRILAQVAKGQPGVVPLQTLITAPPPGSTLPFEPFSSITLQHETSGIQFALDAAQLKELVPSGDPQFLNEEALRAIVVGWAEQVFVPAQDARLHFDENAGRLLVLQPSQTGQRLHIDLTVEVVRHALTTDQRLVVLPIEIVPPAVDSARLDALGINEQIASGTTSFAGSSRARIHNIEVAAAKFVGVVIPPAGIFSFNAIIEAVSAANGFEDSAIIWGDRIAVGVGGGVCQVSTTVFRAALQAGFPLIERYNHGYAVSWYGEPGLDATIYTPSVDFKFLNDSGAHLLIQPLVNRGTGLISFHFYGTKPDRQVIISEPVYTHIKQPGAPIYREDASLAAGQIKQVEWPKEGMTATVTRTVTENGQIREDPIISVYQPWNAVFLYGPGSEIPGITDQPAPDSEDSEGEPPNG